MTISLGVCLEYEILWMQYNIAKTEKPFVIFNPLTFYHASDSPNINNLMISVKKNRLKNIFTPI